MDVLAAYIQKYTRKDLQMEPPKISERRLEISVWGKETSSGERKHAQEQF